jgi:lysophospholipase L1-like esterase
MGTIICLGDSLTYGYGVRRAQCWTELAAKMSGWNVVNRGICGDTTGGMLVRLREILREEIGERNERCFLLMGGCNDIFFSGSSTGARENMAAMAHQLFAEGEMPLIAVGPGIADGSYPSMWSDLVDFPEAGKVIRQYYEWLERFCSSFGVRMIDFRGDFRDREGNIRTELYLDGLHLNPEGHRVMAERVAKVLGVMDRETMNP